MTFRTSFYTTLNCGAFGELDVIVEGDVTSGVPESIVNPGSPDEFEIMSIKLREPDVKSAPGKYTQWRIYKGIDFSRLTTADEDDRLMDIALDNFNRGRTE